MPDYEGPMIPPIHPANALWSADDILDDDNYVKIDALRPRRNHLPLVTLGKTADDFYSRLATDYDGPVMEPDPLGGPFFPSEGAIDQWMIYGLCRSRRRRHIDDRLRVIERYVITVAFLMLALGTWIIFGADWVG